jgi:BASS family bile acid:Na+ symporter
LLQGVSVNPWDIAQSLIVTILIPLAIGLLLKSHSPESAAHWAPVMSKISGLAIMIMLVVGLGLNAKNILSLIGSGGLLALIIFIAGCLLIGLLLGGRNPKVRSVMGLGTAQRNVAAAIVVASQNFSEGNTLVFILVAAILLLLILMPVSKRLGAGATALEAAPGQVKS